MGKNRRREKNRARLCIVYIFIYFTSPSVSVSPSIYIYYNGCKGIYIEKFFQSFLAKKSYDSWITRRRMEIYTKISKRKDLVWSRQKQGKIRTTQGSVRIWKVLCEIFAQAWSSCLPKAISSSFQLQIVHGLKRWIPEL